MYYPQTTLERYSDDVAAVGATFPWLLFEPGRLPEVTHLRFQEYLEGEGLSLPNRAWLIASRHRLGRPRLKRVNVFAVPPSKALRRLDGSGEQFTFDALIEFNFDVNQHDLPPELQTRLPPGSTAPVILRMREPYEIRPLTPTDTPVAGARSGQLFVFSRSYWPFLERSMGMPHDQHDFVGRQVKFYAQNGAPMTASELWLPTWQAYNQIMKDQFSSDPTVGD